MSRFRYAADPLFLLACAAYSINRWIVKPHTNSTFFHGTFNDLLLIPAALPVVLMIQRLLGWRSSDQPPTAGEIFGHWLVWSIVCEGIAPLLWSRPVGDFRDVMAYGIGAFLAGLWWNRPQISQTQPANFDFISGHYDWMENFLAGKKLSRCREAFLDKIPRPRRALLAGEGHGRFLVTLLERYPETHVTYLDSSLGMMKVAKKRLHDSGQPASRVTFLQDDLQKQSLSHAQYDLIATHFALDCFSTGKLPAVISSLTHAASPGAVWLVSDFQLPEKNTLLRTRAAVILWSMYRFFRIVTHLPASRLVPPAPILRQQGFALQRRKEYDWGLLYAEMWRRE